MSSAPDLENIVSTSSIRLKYFHFCSALILPSIFTTPAHANDVSINYSVNGNPLVVSASADRFAGAIVSLTFRGVQYVDIYDHGREIQSAIQLDNLGECYNPNEAGSETDGTGQTTTSILHLISNTNNVLQTQTQPAFWLPKNYNYNKPCNPNLPYPDNLISTAQNTTDLSNYTIARTTSFSARQFPIFSMFKRASPSRRITLHPTLRH